MKITRKQIKEVRQALQAIDQMMAEIMRDDGCEFIFKQRLYKKGEKK